MATSSRNLIRSRQTAVVGLVFSALLVAACGSRPTSQPPASVDLETTVTTRPRDPRVNSADVVVFWSGYRQIAGLTDAELDDWKRRGVDGFVAMTHGLRGLGGVQDFTDDKAADLGSSRFDIQRLLRDTDIVHRARARDMKMYLGFYMVNYHNTRTPLVEWFDDEGWEEDVLPRMREIAAAARQLGFAGLAVDQELYPQVGNARTASWNVQYPGNTNDPETTRAKVKLRGQQIMSAMLKGFPNLEIVAYATAFPESWGELVQWEANKIANANAHSVQVDLWDGMTSVEGYSAIRFIDADFYKGTSLTGSTWDTANQYNVNRIYSLLSRRWSNWRYASSRVYVSPFTWIDAGLGAFEAARPPDYVAAQLRAARKWGTGGEFANYAPGLTDFEYDPYVGGLRAASQPGIVDAEPPVVGPVTVEQGDRRVDLAGVANDNLGIRAVRWESGRLKGTAQMTWKVLSGDWRSGWTWEMAWSASAVPLGAGASEIVVEVEDVKGLVTRTTVTVG